MIPRRAGAGRRIAIAAALLLWLAPLGAGLAVAAHLELAHSAPTPPHTADHGHLGTPRHETQRHEAQRHEAQPAQPHTRFHHPGPAQGHAHGPGHPSGQALHGHPHPHPHPHPHASGQPPELPTEPLPQEDRHDPGSHEHELLSPEHEAPPRSLDLLQLRSEGRSHGLVASLVQVPHLEDSGALLLPEHPPPRRPSPRLLACVLLL